MGLMLSVIAAEAGLVAAGILSSISASKGSGDSKTYAIYSAVIAFLAAVLVLVLALLL